MHIAANLHILDIILQYSFWFIVSIAQRREPFRMIAFRSLEKRDVFYYMI